MIWTAGVTVNNMVWQCSCVMRVRLVVCVRMDKSSQDRKREGCRAI